MAEHSIFGVEFRPDQQQYAKLMGGMASPLWIPFMAAASMGAAWWMMQNWPRVASGLHKPAGNGGGNGAAAGDAQSAQSAAAARSFAQEVTAPVTESLAVQGANDAEASAPAARTAPAPSAPAPAPQAKPAAQAAPKASPARKAEPDQDPAVSKLLAAAADHPEPELPPHEGLPARKKGGGKGKKNGG